MSKLLRILIISLFSLSCSSADKLELKNGSNTILTYNAGFVPSPDPAKPWYGRSGFIHPVKSPSGLTVTDAFPKDHMHQHALMFAWTSAKIKGEKVDFWNSHKKLGRIEHVETVSAGSDKIVVKLRYIDISGGKDNHVLNETWEINTVSYKGVNAFTLKSIQTCTSDKPFELTKYHYGAMCVRGSSQWIKGLKVLTSEGKDRKAGNHSRPDWVTMNGSVDGKKCGIAAMCHPRNFRAPQPVRIHPDKPYFCFAPIILDGFKIEPGKPYVSKFLFVTYDGEADKSQLDRIYQDYCKSQ